MPDVVQILIGFSILLLSLTIHEMSHAWTADRLGDPTARLLGRVSLNPLVHADPVGTFLFPLLAAIYRLPLLGWAKPVPVRVHNLRRHRRDYVLVAAAGPASNLVLAVIGSMVLRTTRTAISQSDTSDIFGLVALVALQAVEINVLLAVFNMLPIPPLDGGNVLAGVLPPRLAGPVNMVRPYGVLLIYALMLSNTLDSIIGPPYSFLMSWLR